MPDRLTFDEQSEGAAGMFSILIFLNSVFYDLSTFCQKKECLIMWWINEISKIQ